MADFRTLAKDLCLADGKIDDTETKILKKHLYADGKIDQSELEFLIALRSDAQKKGGCGASFESFFMKAVYDSILGNGIISNAEAKLLRKAIFADGKVEDDERRLVKKLKINARKTSPAFERLYNEVVG